MLARESLIPFTATGWGRAPGLARGVCISPSPHRDALMLAPDPDLSHIRPADLLDADVGVLPCIRRVRPTRDLPRSGLVDEPVADLELHRKDPLLGGARRRRLVLLALLLGPRPSHSLVEPARASNLTPQGERLPELHADLRPRLRAPPRVQHHAQDAIDAEPGIQRRASVSLISRSTVSAGLHSTTGRMRADSESDGTVQDT